MLIEDLRLLEYLHDAEVSELVYDTSQRKTRTAVLQVSCAADAGYAAWDGKLLRIRLENIVVMSLFAFGAVIGQECISSWTPTVSSTMESELRRLHKAGIDCAGVRFCIAFQSGSWFEGVCQRVVVEQAKS